MVWCCALWSVSTSDLNFNHYGPENWNLMTYIFDRSHWTRTWIWTRWTWLHHWWLPATSMQRLLSLYLVGAACTQWKNRDGEVSICVDQNFPFLLSPYSICTFNKTFPCIFYFSPIFHCQTTPLTKLFP